ncbi:unnamed protein product [Paramecium octaurelia]|uniref:Ubiquitin-like domain-containing protein n=1 Tax=Paramecium octaurelia TaxID=43137 RepID=A0A8S1X698_PAROT|nr:unnamed protein product [Paramecium octaurelia]
MEKIYKVHIDNLDKDIQVDINDNETLEKLVEKIRDLQKLPFQNVDVFCENNKLDVKFKINVLNINNSSSINVKLFYYVKVKVTNEMQESCEISKINIYDKLACLNKQIYNEFGISNYHLDLYQGQTLLEPYQSLYQQQILKDCDLRCVVKPTFLVEYKSEVYTFFTLLNEDFKNINEKVKQRLNLKLDFELIYNEQVINNEGDNYYNYSIPQNQKLELKILDSVILIVSSVETQSFKVSKSVQIQELTTYLKQLYSITEEVSLTKGNQKLLPEQTVQELKLKDYEILKLEQITMSDLYLINNLNPKQQFKKKIDIPITLKFLQDLPQFKEKKIHFYNSSQQQLSNQDEIKLEPKITIYYKEISQSQIFSWLQIGFLNKQTQVKIIKKVPQNDIIDKYIQELVGTQQSNFWLGDQQISKGHTFEGIGAQNNDCITFEVIKRSVLVSYREQNHIIEVQDDWTFAKLKQTLLHQFQNSTNNYCLIHRDAQPELHQNILAIYKEGDVILFTDQKPSLVINQSRILDNMIPITIYIVDKQDEITLKVKCNTTVQNLIDKFKKLFQINASINFILKLNQNRLQETFEINSTHSNAKFFIEQFIIYYIKLMLVKFYCIQFGQTYVIPVDPKSVLQQVVDSIKQEFRFNDATSATAYINGKIINCDLTIEKLNIGENSKINLQFFLSEYINFQLKEDGKQVKTLIMNIYISILEAERQLAMHILTDYHVEIILNDKKLCKSTSLYSIGSEKVHKFQMKVNLQIKNLDKLYFFRFSVFDTISNIKQKIRNQLQIKGGFWMFYNDRIQIDKMDNMEETIYSLQIPNYQTLTINRQQHITFVYKFNQCAEQYQIQTNQSLRDKLDEIRRKHRVLNNSEYQIKCNGQVVPELPISKDKEFLIEDVIEVEENKDESTIITIINFFNKTNRELKVVNIKQTLGALKNIIKNQNDKCTNVEFIFHGNQQLDDDNKTFQQLGFESNKHYLIQYVLYESKKSSRNNIKQQQIKQYRKDIFEHNKKQHLTTISHNRIYFTENENFNEGDKTDNTNNIIVNINCNQGNQDFQIPQQVIIDENMIISQSIIYKAIQKYKDTFILKYNDRPVDIGKSLKELGIENDSIIEVALYTDYQKQVVSQDEDQVNNADVIIQIQFFKDGIQRMEQKKYNLYTIKFALIKKALLTEYQLPDNYELMYNGNRVNLNSNIQGVIKESENLFILEEQVNSNDRKRVTLVLKMIPDGSPKNQSIQVDKELELSSLYHLVQQKIKQQNFTLFYDGEAIKNQKETFLELKDDREEEVEVLLEDVPSSNIL